MVVPSGSLRRHLLATLAERQGAVLGLSCLTLHSLARTVLARCGKSVPHGGDLLFEILARRFARQERPLADPLAGLSDGFAAVAVTVRDLLDAGFDPAHAEALDEALTAEGGPAATRQAIARARAVVRIAGRTAEELERLGTGGPSELLRRAAEEVLADPTEALPPGEIVVHGFADATGLATDLLRAVLDRRGGTVYFDLPPDPTDEGKAVADDPALIFGRRFRRRLLAGVEGEMIDRSPPKPAVGRYRALGESAEVREAAERILALLADGLRPENVAIVARDLSPYGTQLRVHLSRLGIPFSAGSHAGPPHPATRRIEVLLELLERRDSITLESWLDILAGVFERTDLNDLRLAMASSGRRRLRDLAASGKTIDAARIRLPVFDGLGEWNGETRPLRRQVDPSDLGRLVDIARATAATLADWPDDAPVPAHLANLEQLIWSDLEWDRDDPISLEVRSALDSIRALAPGVHGDLSADTGAAAMGVDASPTDLVLSREELSLLLRRALESGDRPGDSRLSGTTFGGAGSGVQVLSAVEARGRTFEHLFVIGLNRGRFPRTIREDPILPDDLRQVLAHDGHGVLPDLASKRTGHFEERFLFAQLLSSAAAVTLSWLEIDDEDGRASPSPLVERLRWKGGDSPENESDIPLARPILALDPPANEAAPRPRTAYEAAIVGGTSDRHHLKRFLPLALTEAWDAVDSEESPSGVGPNSRRVAEARLAVLSEWDSPPTRGKRRSRPPGPYLGLIGAPLDDADPRRANKLWVTTLEALSSCPWQTFLGRVLGLEPLPEPLDGPPRLDARFKGVLVHEILERMVEGEAMELETFAAEDGAPSSPVVWPDEVRLESNLQAAAAQLLRREGVDYPGFSAVLVAAARPHLEVARALHGLEPTPGEKCAVEIRGSTGLFGNGRPTPRVHFKADLVTRIDRGLRLTDFKTGKPPSEAVKPDTRRKTLLKQIASGRLLQAPAYALAAAELEGEKGASSGRYAHLAPDVELGRLTWSVATDDDEAFVLFRDASSTLWAQWELGLFFPRLEKADREEEPKTCNYCDLKEACARGDSGMRARMRHWFLDLDEDPASDRESVSSALAAGWRLSATKDLSE